VIVSTTCAAQHQGAATRNAKLLCEVTDLNPADGFTGRRDRLRQLGFLSRHRQAAGGGAEGRQALHPTRAVRPDESPNPNQVPVKLRVTRIDLVRTSA